MNYIHSFIHLFVHPTTDSPFSIHTSILPPPHPSNHRLPYIHHSPTQAPPNHPNLYPYIHQFFHKSTYLPVLYFVHTNAVSGNYVRSASTYMHMHPHRPNPRDVSASAADMRSRCAGPGYVSQNSRYQVLALYKGYNTFVLKYSYFMIVSFKLFKLNGLTYTHVCHDVGLFKQWWIGTY